MGTVLKEYIGLDPDSPSGLRWLKRPAHSRVVVGSAAFNVSNKRGYLKGQLSGRTYYAHRVVYYLVHGYWPNFVDHIDGVVTHNNPFNLRDVCNAENQHNRIVPRGYYKDRDKYRALIKVHGKHISLGTATTEEGARTLYLEGKKKYHTTAPERCYDTSGGVAPPR